MTVKNYIKTAFTGLKRNKSRSALTILGIVIGITAIILVMSLGKGAQDLILNQVRGLGSKTLIILPGRQPKGPTDAVQMFGDSLKEKDIALLENKANVPDLARIIPIIFGSDSANYQGETYRLTIIGATEKVSKIFDTYPSEGSFFSEDDIKRNADVAVIGAKVKEQLFGNSEAIGEKIKIKNRNLKVVGVLPKKGQVSFFNFDEMAIIPYTTAQKYIFGKKYFDRLIVEAVSEEAVSRVVNDINLTLRNSHNITDPEKDDFHIETQAGLMSQISTITDVLTLFLLAVAAISLLVGGVGIMNIMLVSVTERTREIGLRKALGATKTNILIQFLLEAVFLTGAGGVVGIILGASFSFLASLVLGRVVGMSWSFTFPTSAAIVGLIVSGAIGLVFGLYPARQASQKSPIEALRYE
jgi:putative ABC transport system permease protein